VKDMNIGKLEFGIKINGHETIEWNVVCKTAGHREKYQMIGAYK